MLISDLEYLEVVSEPTHIEGGLTAIQALRRLRRRLGSISIGGRTNSSRSITVVRGEGVATAENYVYTSSTSD